MYMSVSILRMNVELCQHLGGVCVLGIPIVLITLEISWNELMKYGMQFEYRDSGLIPVP